MSHQPASERLACFQLDDVLLFDGPPLEGAVRLDALLPRLLQNDVACARRTVTRVLMQEATSRDGRRCATVTQQLQSDA